MNNTGTTTITTIKTDTDLFGRSETTSATVNRDVLAKVLAAQLQQMSLTEFVGLFTNTFTEIQEYAALLEGKRTCQRTSLLFNPHRLDTKTKASQRSVYDAIQTNESYASGLARATLLQRRASGKDGVRIETAVRIGVNGIQYVNEFQPHIMRDLCTQYKLNTSSRVLDPCAGWGGRMIGASCVVNTYHAFEPATLTHAGLLNLRSFIRTFRPDFKAKVVCLPFEDADVPTNYYDFACTSPPYYDTEEYSKEDSNSLNRYKNYESWLTGFFYPMVRKTMLSMNENAPFILNIGSRTYPLVDAMHEISKPYGIVIRRLKNAMSVCGLAREKKKEQGESFWELRMK